MKMQPEVIEELMAYTDFTSTDDLKTKDDIDDFLEQVKDYGKSRGKKFSITPKMKRAIQYNLNMFDKAGVKVKKKTLLELEPIKSLKDAGGRTAALRDDKAVIVDDTLVYATWLKQRYRVKVKGRIQYRERNVIRYRTEDGRFFRTKGKGVAGGKDGTEKKED